MNQTTTFSAPIPGHLINKLDKLTGHSYNVTSVAYSPKGGHLASGSYDRTVKLWRATAGEAIASLTGHLSAVSSVTFSPDGALLASGSWDKTIQVWNTDPQVKAATLQGHTAAVESVAFSPDGARLASGSDDNTIRIWDTTSWACMITLKGHPAPVKSVAFSPNRKYLASGSSDYTIQLWNVLSGASTTTMKSHTKTVNSIAFSPDGKYLASGSDDMTVRLWNPDTGTLISTLKEHAGAVYSVAFSYNNRLLVSASGDKTVRVWNLTTGEHTSLTGHTYWVLAVAFSPDSGCFASGSGDKTIQMWEVLPEDAANRLQINVQPASGLLSAPQQYRPSSALSTYSSTGYSRELENSIAALSFGNDITSQITSISLDRIGAGGFGEVFKGAHKNGSVVALKRPRLLVSNNEDVLRRFLREVEIWCRVSHRYVLPCLGTYKTGKEIYVVSPFLASGDLANCIRQGKISNRRRILYEVSEALSHLHGLSIVHGDIKAENILVSDKGSALLSDFGLAKVFDKVTTTSMKAGSTRWMAPEQLQDDGSRTIKTDVYSFGITVAEVLSGETPFRDIPDMKVIEYVVVFNGRPPKEPDSDASGRSYASLWETAEKCWAPNSQDRPYMAQVCGMLFSLTQEDA